MKKSLAAVALSLVLTACVVTPLSDPVAYVLDDGTIRIELNKTPCINPQIVDHIQNLQGPTDEQRANFSDGKYTLNDKTYSACWLVVQLPNTPPLIYVIDTDNDSAVFMLSDFKPIR